MPASVESKEAQHGKKMIEVRIRFWTNDLVEEKGKIRPKHAWGSGIVRIDTNASHGIHTGEAIPFNSLAEIPAKIERVLIDSGVTIHKSSREKKYLA